MIVEHGLISLSTSQDPLNVRGVYQWSGSEAFTKFDMVQIMAKVFHLPAEHISADSSPGEGTPRPRDVTMSRTRLEALGISRHTPFEQVVAKHFAKFIPKH